MGFIARCRLSSIVNTSVSYLTFLKKKKKSSNKKKKTSSSSSSSSSQKYHHPPANPPRKLPNPTHHHTKDVVKKVVIPKKEIDLEKQFAKERFSDEKECLWLSTDRPSTNAYFEQCRSSLSHFLLDERLSVWLSRSSISKVTEWLQRPSAIKAADWLTRSSLSKEGDSFILGRDLPSEEAEILMLTSSASKSSTKVEDLDEDGLNMMISLVNLDDPAHRSSISGTALLEGSDGEPLFWPFELKFEMDGDEQVGYFCMSPRKDIVAKVDSKGRIEFPKLTKRNSSTMISSSSCAKLVAVSLEGGSIPFEKILSFKRDWLGREDISFSDQVPIENMLGLGEFDGHEGLADEDTFSLDGSFSFLMKN